MNNYKSGSHTRYDLKYHIVWITKYRKPIMSGQISERVREIIRETCMEEEVTILKGHVSKDHIHLMVSCPPHLAVSKLVQRLKGKSSYKMLREFELLRKKFWGNHLWARGYFVSSTGNVTDEAIMRYIEEQDKNQSTDDDFQIGTV